MASTCKQRNELPDGGIGELSLLPLFLDLNGKKALVVGDSQGARWKVELLCAAGAEVLRLDAFPNEECTLSIYSFIVADIADEAEAAKFAEAAKAAGVAFNIVDKPELCQFQFGAIVNRSPVIVSISTSGAAPVLAQTIRQRIESILPESLGAWGTLAKRLRGRITHTIHDSALRRAVWQRFAGLAMSGVLAPNSDEGHLIETLFEAPSKQRTSITLQIPQERDLMTLKNCRALMNADVVYDCSGEDFVKSLMRREAEYISLDPSQSEEVHVDQNRNVVVCVSAMLPEVWQRVIDLPELEGYRHFP
jgi:uroporphyrin-III C-methyltransferase / precorrin-2 dehydrogenase / sirohydrochlorin ferrochelatase